MSWIDYMRRWLFTLRKEPWQAIQSALVLVVTFVVFNLIIEDRLANWVNKELDQRLEVSPPGVLGLLAEWILLALASLAIIALAIRIGWHWGRRRAPWRSDLLERKVRIGFMNASIRLGTQPVLVIEFRIHNYGVCAVHVTGQGRGHLKEAAWGELTSYWIFQEATIQEDHWATLCLTWNITDPILRHIAVATGDGQSLDLNFANMAIEVEAVGLNHKDYVALPGSTEVGPFRDTDTYRRIRKEVEEAVRATRDS